MNFDKLDGLVPAIIQDAYTDRVLMLGFMNQEALRKTREEGRVTFFSRTRQKLWTKGEESGHYLNVADIIEDCDQDTLLSRQDPKDRYATPGVIPVSMRRTTGESILFSNCRS